MADIDYFKCYNDCNGHPAGDYALQKIAEIMKGLLKVQILLRAMAEKSLYSCSLTHAKKTVHIVKQ